MNFLDKISNLGIMRRGTLVKVISDEGKTVRVKGPERVIDKKPLYQCWP